MKFDIFKYVLFVAISILIAWGGYEMCVGYPQNVMLASGLGVSLLILFALICIETPEYPRSQVNIRVIAYVTILLSLTINIIFAFFSFSPFGYFIPNGMLVLISLLITRSIINAKQ